ncbi:S1 RNA-binding domain-containing protein [Saccharothrix longispora]|uniref:RNA-binding protein with RPS1 domain n=1 Tax=Saccharothrix longispora TaxID=33920 RepID=A0ABU1PMA2_9PSEU|nr:S1 RNA-binding domain-containing protein [Saccharothrix longispora]MDR6591796.1 putative RNA-binding protein with RPS1 domain [Saccharothrix longispora]
MSDLDFTRRERTIDGNAFVASPYGVKNGFDHDEFHRNALAPVITLAGMTPVRADSIYGPQTIMGAVYRGIEQAEVVIVDFTGRNANVAMEFMMAAMIGKRMIYLTQDEDDIPTDIRGRVRVIKYSDHYLAIDEMKLALANQLTSIRAERSVEMALLPMASGGTDPVQARVVTVTKDFVVVEALDGRRGVLGNADVDYQRIVPDMARLFSVGDPLSGAFEVDIAGGVKYTLLSGTPNPWHQLGAEFPVGRRFTGVVQRRSEKLGAFVLLDHGISGLVHNSVLAGRQWGIGDEVEVMVTRMDKDKRLIALQPLGPVAPSKAKGRFVPVQRTSEENSGFTKGQRLEGEVTKALPEGKGGYVLLRLSGRTRPVMLHCTAMTEGTRTDLNAGEVEIGDVLDVEIDTIDVTRDRITVRELDENEADVDEPITV